MWRKSEIKMIEHVIHPITPVYDAQSTVLILGSFPSKKSREQMFFYGHPQNRFWKVLAQVFDCTVPKTIEEKRRFLQEHHVALWDVIASCDIVGSADGSIVNVVPNNFEEILSCTAIQRIFVNGKTAEKYYNTYLKTVLGREAVYLPSTSPANAAWSLERLVAAWAIVR